MKFQIEGQNVIFSGVLDESFLSSEFLEQIKKLRSTIKSRAVNLDFSNVLYANSIGIANWIKLIDQLKEGTYYYSKTPIWLVHLMSIISGVVPENFYVTSMSVPFYSENHDKEIQVLMEIGRDIPLLDDYSSFNLESKTVDGILYEPDISEDHYFRFLVIDSVRLKKMLSEHRKNNP